MTEINTTNAKSQVNNEVQLASAGLSEVGSLPSGVSLGRVIIDQINALINAEHFDPATLIDTLKLDPELARLLKQPAVREGYSIEEHTLMVMRQFEKYFADVEMPSGISRDEMRLMLALHDIGKGIGDDRGEQHSHTTKVMESLLAAGLFCEDTFKLLMVPLSFDAIGKFYYLGVQNGPKAEDKLVLAQAIARGQVDRADFDEFVRDIRLVSDPRLSELASEAAQAILEMTAKSGLSVKELINILIIYYQCDTTAYTFDADRDFVRSQVLSDSEVGNIKFNHDKVLKPTPGLDMQSGDASWQAYARLEAAARAGDDPSFPLSRGYPSLDFLYKLADDFDPASLQTGANMFRIDSEGKRLEFSEPIDVLYQLLLKKLNREKVNQSN